MTVSEQRQRGRPRKHEDAELLSAAFHAFAESGFEAMSVRTLATDLGLSHGALNRRFGSKRELFDAALVFGFDRFFAEIAEELSTRPIADDLATLRETMRAFLVVAARRPEFGRLMNQEGLMSSDRFDFFVELVLRPAMETMAAVVDRLVASGTIHPISLRALFFLIAHGAAAPFTLTALSAAFDEVDGPLDLDTHVEGTVHLIMRGLVV